MLGHSGYNFEGNWMPLIIMQPSDSPLQWSPGSTRRTERGGTTSGLHQMQLFVQIKAHGVGFENVPRVLHLGVDFLPIVSLEILKSFLLQYVIIIQMLSIQIEIAIALSCVPVFNIEAENSET